MGTDAGVAIASDAGFSIARALEQALAHHRAGRLPQAEAIYRRILAIEPDNAECLHLLGAMAIQLDRNDVAVDYIGQAIRKLPSVALYHSNLGVALKNLGRFDAASACCREALRLEPANLDAHVALGHVHQAERRWDAAEACYRQALQLDPDHALARMNLANTYQEQGRFEQAEFHYRGALDRDPDYAEAHKNYGVALSQRGLLKRAVGEFRAAIRLRPAEPSWHMALGQILLLDGQFDEGWQAYEARWQTRSVHNQPRGFAQPQWTGEAIGDRCLLLHAEQGLGDTLQFCRYVPAIAATARVVLEVQQPLVTLLGSLPGVAQLVARGDPLPPFDLHCPLLTLPRIRQTTLATIPGPARYLAADPNRIAVWRARLAPVPGLKVGLVWAGGVVTLRNRERSVACGDLAILADIPGVSFISLQKYQLAGVAEPIPSELKLHDWTGELGDFADTAALVNELDLVISVDTAVVHLAGALGRPVWLLNRFAPCWRWLLERDDSPWYPSLRQFRQTRLGDWDGVLVRVRSELARLAERNATPPSRENSRSLADIV